MVQGISELYQILTMSDNEIDLAEGVIVDGDKKEDLSPTENQLEEREAIDPFSEKTCGISDINPADQEFIDMAREGQFPWIVSFQIKILNQATMAEQVKAARHKNYSKRNRKNIDQHFCGGSLIADNWILTSAHCFALDIIKNYMQSDKLRVVAGSHMRSSRYRNNQNLTLKRIYYHDRFDSSKPIGFDIALVELNQKVKLTQRRMKNEEGLQDGPFMNTICLPLESKRYQFNESARVAGWGQSNFLQVNSMPTKLLVTDLLLEENKKCSEIYNELLNDTYTENHRKKYDDFICAGYKTTRDTCLSDSGGPLMQFSNDKAVAIGIVSFGIGCATKGVPGLYTRTSAYINWIKDIMAYGDEASVGFKVIESKGAAKIEDISSGNASSIVTLAHEANSHGGLRTTLCPHTLSSTTLSPSTTPISAELPLLASTTRP